MSAYFVSETPDTTIYLPAEKVKWVTSDNRIGTWKTHNETSITKMREYISRKVGGVVREVTEAEFAELEKKTSERPVVWERESIGGDSAASTLPAPSAPVADAPSAVVAENTQPVEPAAPVEPVLRKRGSANVPK